MSDTSEGSADSGPSEDVVPRLEFYALADLLASDDSALATAVRGILQAMESPEKNYAAFGNTP